MTSRIIVAGDISVDCYVEERRLAGWKPGSRRSVDRKISPYLVPWKELPERIKDIDRKAVKAIPQQLSRAGFEIYRLTH